MSLTKTTMKLLSGSVLALMVFARVSCQSGTVGARADYSDASYDELRQKINDRAKVLRSLDPELTESDAIAQASREFDHERAQLRKEKKQKAAQDKFEQDLARSVDR